MASALTIVNSQNQRLEEEYKRLPITDKPFALIDFPNHANVGDSAIWLGELALLKRCFGRVPNYMCDIDNFSKELMDEKVPDGPILLSGGGNFGDIWPVHQSFREYIISAFPDRQIVQLPQSVKFNSSDGVIRFANLVKHHPTFTLLVRDSPSEKFAVQNFGCSVRLCPDSAFAIGPITSYVKRSSDLTLLMRTDIESKSISSNSYLSGVTLNLVDWMHESRFFIPT